MELLEIEIKAYCDNEDDVLSRIQALGGRLVERRTERDAYFNHPGRNFKKTDEALRIRDTGDSAVLTYKGPKIGNRSKTRIEHEAGIDDAAGLAEILRDLGFVESGRVVKDRRLYTIEGIEICLDRVEGLGLFVELEKKHTNREKIETELFALAEKLGLSRFERRSYLEMILG
jgi:adenylate cyclase, class 2